MYTYRFGILFTKENNHQPIDLEITRSQGYLPHSSIFINSQHAYTIMLICVAQKKHMYIYIYVNVTNTKMQKHVHGQVASTYMVYCRWSSIP